MNEKREKVLSYLISGIKMLAATVILLFFLSPFEELIHRVYFNSVNGGLYFNEKRNSVQNNMDIVLYWELTNKIYNLSVLLVKIILVISLIYVLLNLEVVRAKLKKCINIFVPFICFGLFSGAIYLSGRFRGITIRDISGDAYRGESMYMFMAYPFVFFLCGLLILQSKHKKILLYMLIISSMPINTLAIINEFFHPIYYFVGEGMSAVFYQFNHYGYYLMIIVVTSAYLNVYEEKTLLKIISILSFLLATITLVMNDTLGAFLAALSVLIFIVAYSLLFDKEHGVLSIAILCIFLATSLLCSIIKDSLLESLFKTVLDVHIIVTDGEGANSAGTGRWYIWKETIKHIAEKPLYGWGIETMWYDFSLVAPHNELLLYAVYFGIPVAVLYVMSVAFILVLSIRNINAIDPMARLSLFVTLGYLISSMFGNTMHYTTPFLFCFLGLAYSGYVNNYLSEKLNR